MRTKSTNMSIHALDFGAGCSCSHRQRARINPDEYSNGLATVIASKFYVFLGNYVSRLFTWKCNILNDEKF